MHRRRRACVWRYSVMDKFATTFDAPILLSLATALRRLACDSLCHGDRALYLPTAEASRNTPNGQAPPSR